uniref:Uncharacterized protein n=1 Tax=Ditylenchus dipsaci TaxID=166011 RepID=A0A915CQL0_9BILA
MEDSALLNAIAWWFLRKRRSYVRLAHYQAAFQRNSFETFWRYYRSPDERDLVRFLRLSRAEFDEVHSKIRCLLDTARLIFDRYRTWKGLPFFSGTRKDRSAFVLHPTFRFIAFGPTYCAVAHLFAIGDSTVYDICKEVSQAIVTVMQAEFMPPPNRQTWERPEIAQLYTTAAVILHNYLKPSSIMTMEYIFAFRMIDDYLLIKERQKPEELEEELGNNLLML